MFAHFLGKKEAPAKFTPLDQAREELAQAQFDLLEHKRHAEYRNAMVAMLRERCVRLHHDIEAFTREMGYTTEGKGLDLDIKVDITDAAREQYQAELYRREAAVVRQEAEDFNRAHEQEAKEARIAQQAITSWPFPHPMRNDVQV